MGNYMQEGMLLGYLIYPVYTLSLWLVPLNQIRLPDQNTVSTQQPHFLSFQVLSSQSSSAILLQKRKETHSALYLHIIKNKTGYSSNKRVKNHRFLELERNQLSWRQYISYILQMWQVAFIYQIIFSCLLCAWPSSFF